MMSKSHDTRPSWYSQLEENPVPARSITQGDIDEFTSRLRTETHPHMLRKIRSRRAWMYSTAGLLGVLLLCGILVLSPLIESLTQSNQATHQGNAYNEQWLARDAYSEDGQLIMQAFPGGDLQAGLPAGCWWNLYVPYEEIQGQQIAIHATHQETGLQIVELPPTEVVETMRYEDFTRVSSTFGVPLEGTWKFEVSLDNDFLGDVVIEVPEGEWENSTEFQSGTYSLVGTKGHLGLLSPGFVVNAPNKYMWHLWGPEEMLSGEFQVYGVKKGSNQLEEVLTKEVTAAPLNGADAAVHCMMSLPSSGQWKLIVLINGQWFGSLVVEAIEEAEVSTD